MIKPRTFAAKINQKELKTMKPQKFKRFTVTDVAGLAAAYPGVVRHEPRADPFKVQKLLDCGVDLWRMEKG